MINLMTLKRYLDSGDEFVAYRIGEDYTIKEIRGEISKLTIEKDNDIDVSVRNYRLRFSAEYLYEHKSSAIDRLERLFSTKIKKERDDVEKL